MIKNIVFISLLSILSIAVSGQEKIILKTEAFSDVNPNALFKTPNQLVYLYKVGEGDFQGIGFKGKHLEAALIKDEAAYKEFKKFKRKIAIGKTFYWIGAAVPLALLYSINDNTTEQQFINRSVSALVIMVGGLTTTYLSFKNAPKHLHNAVMLYNQNLEK